MDNAFWKPRVDGDWNRDGVPDSQNNPTVQGWLRSGSKSYFDYIRSIWPGSLQIGNIADWGASMAWGGVDAEIGVLDQQLLAIFGHDNWIIGDYRGMRYGLASTLMDDGYYYVSGQTGYDPGGCVVARCMAARFRQWHRARQPQG